MAGVFVTLVGALWTRSHPGIAGPRPRKHDAGSPRIDSVNLAANQYFPAAQTALCVLSLVPNADLDLMKRVTANINVSDALRELGEWSLAYRDESGFSWWLSGLTRSFAETRILEVLGYWRDAARRDGALDEGAARVLIALTSWTTLFNFLHLRGYWRECIAHWEPAAEATRITGPKPSLMSIVGNLAITYQQIGDVMKAEKGCREAIEVSKELGNDIDVSAGLHNLGVIAQRQGRLEEAEDLYRRSLEIDERIGDQQGIAATFGQLGLLAEQQGDLAPAEQRFADAVRIFEGRRWRSRPGGTCSGSRPNSARVRPPRQMVAPNRSSDYDFHAHTLAKGRSRPWSLFAELTRSTATVYSIDHHQASSISEGSHLIVVTGTCPHPTRLASGCGSM